MSDSPLEIWAVSWSCDTGADVYLFWKEEDAEIKYDELCKEANVNPALGYASAGYGYADEYPGEADADGDSALWGEDAVEIDVKGPLAVAGAPDFPGLLAYWSKGRADIAHLATDERRNAHG